MTDHGMQPARKLPAGLVGLFSLAIGFHLFALLVLVLAAHSGPWTVAYLPMRGTLSQPPQFASVLRDYCTRFYLEPLALANDYHFVTNHTDLPTVHLEARAENQKTLKFPDPQAGVWVRYRQSLLAQSLGNDAPFQGEMEKVRRPQDQQVPQIIFVYSPQEALLQKLSNLKDKPFDSRDSFLAALADNLTKDELAQHEGDILKAAKVDLKGFDIKGLIGLRPPQYMLTPEAIMKHVGGTLSEDKTQEIYQVDEHRIPRFQLMSPMPLTVLTPAPMTMLLVRSMSRYLERQHGQQVELTRQHRDPISPALMFPSMKAPGALLVDDPPYPLETRSCNFGNGQPKKWSPR